MPSFGSLDHERLLPHVPRVEDLASERIESGAVEILFMAAELSHETAAEYLPPALTPVLPPFARIEIRKHEDSPWGAFHIACLELPARAAGCPVCYVTGGFCDNDRAAEYLRLHYGARLKRGAISLERRYTGIEARIASEGRLVFDGLVERPEPIAEANVPAMPLVHLAKFEGALWLVEEDIDHSFFGAEMGSTLVRSFEADAFGEARLALRAPMPAIFSRCSSVYLPVRRVIDAGQPAETGTREIAAA
jgi:hypothetical protein